MEFDYRQVFTSVMKDWFNASDEAITMVKFENFVENRVDYVECKALSTTELFQENLTLHCYPNPTQEQLNVSYYLKQEAEVRIDLLDFSGRKIASISEPPSTMGNHDVVFDLSRLAPGTYLVRLFANDAVLMKKIILSH
jgi:hypothetical protein